MDGRDEQMEPVSVCSWAVMPVLVTGIHVLANDPKEDVDGRDEARP